MKHDRQKMAERMSEMLSPELRSIIDQVDRLDELAGQPSKSSVARIRLPYSSDSTQYSPRWNSSSQPVNWLLG